MGLSGLNADTKIHLVFKLRDGRKAWHCGTDRQQHPQTFVWMTLPKLDLDAAASVPMRLDYAVIAARNWRDLGYNVRLALEPNGEFIDDDPTPIESIAERTPKYAIVAGVGDILIVPGSDKFWYVRFPNSGFESLKANTPEEVVEAFEQIVAVRPQMARFVERYVAPEPAVQSVQQPQQAAPQFRRRPGDIPR